MNTLYLITHIASNKCYVGWTSREIKSYWKSHISAANGPKVNKRHIHNAIKKYGPEAFSWEVIAVFDTADETRLCERYWIARLKEFGIEIYNSTNGGEGIPGVRLSDETKKKLSIAHTGKKLSEEHKQKIRNTFLRIGFPMLGKTHSIEARKKISLSKLGKPGRKLTKAHKAILLTFTKGRIVSLETREKLRIINTGIKRPGRVLSEETKKKISLSRIGRFAGENASMYGKKHTDEAKSKISLARTGTHHTEETKQKLRVLSTGKKHTDEAKRKVSMAKKGWIASPETREKMSNSARNKPPVSEETKQKHKDRIAVVGANMLGKNHSEESKLKMSISHTGKIISDETKLNMSNATKGDNNPMSKLSEKEVIELRYLYDNELRTKYDLVKEYSLKYDMSPRSVERAIIRMSWKHLK